MNVTPTSAWAIGTNTYNLLSFTSVTANVSDFTKGTIGLLTSRELNAGALGQRSHTDGCRGLRSGRGLIMATGRSAPRD